MQQSTHLHKMVKYEFAKTQIVRIKIILSVIHLSVIHLSVLSVIHLSVIHLSVIHTVCDDVIFRIQFHTLHTPNISYLTYTEHGNVIK